VSTAPRRDQVEPRPHPDPHHLAQDVLPADAGRLAARPAPAAGGAPGPDDARPPSGREPREARPDHQGDARAGGYRSLEHELPSCSHLAPVRTKLAILRRVREGGSHRRHELPALPSLARREPAEVRDDSRLPADEVLPAALVQVADRAAGLGRWVPQHAVLPAALCEDADALAGPLSAVVDKDLGRGRRREMVAPGRILRQRDGLLRDEVVSRGRVETARVAQAVERRDGGFGQGRALWQQVVWEARWASAKAKGGASWGCLGRRTGVQARVEAELVLCEIGDPEDGVERRLGERDRVLELEGLVKEGSNLIVRLERYGPSRDRVSTLGRSKGRCLYRDHSLRTTVVFSSSSTCEASDHRLMRAKPCAPPSSG
jgi:hypothetical protein